MPAGFDWANPVAGAPFATVGGRFQGKPLPPNLLVSAVWVKTDGKWLELHYQETVLAAER